MQARSVADIIQPFVERLLRGRQFPLPLVFWDGSSIGPRIGGATITVTSPDAFRRLLFAPGELGFGRALVAGDIRIEGDIYAVARMRDDLAEPREGFGIHADAGTALEFVKVIRALKILGRPLPPPKEEARLRGRRHTKERDAAAVRHHYDVGNDFYRLVLGPSMTYSCAFFPEPDASLEDAQTAKYELICRKLGLSPGMRLLDVGCGWGGMALHAARHYGVTVVGITLAKEQAALAAERVSAARLTSRVEIRLQDYRDVVDGPYDRISSIGMFEHVGEEAQRAYFTTLLGLLPPRGRLLNHAISSPDTRNSPASPRSFIGAYVFPDGQLHEVGTTITTMQNLSFEVRDVENLREHYALTLRHWVANLETHWDEAVSLVGEGRALVWRLYLALSAEHFASGRTFIHQVLAIKQDSGGASGMALTRDWLGDAQERFGAFARS